MIGGKTLTFTYQEKDFCSNDSHNIALYLKDERYATRIHYLFFIAALRAALRHRYSWGNSISMQRIKHESIYLPMKNNHIDFDFMERFITVLEAGRIAKLNTYLSSSGLDKYELTEEEYKIIHGGGVNTCSSMKEFSFCEIFDHIRQGRRLKKEDQRPGDLPFVMSGTSNTGVVNYVSNAVASFPKNAITIDIFGNTFYRNYGFGAGDDTGVYWSEGTAYTKEVMLFFTAAMQCAVKDRFSYGKKLRSSQSLDFKMVLPTKDGVPDFTYMKTLIRSVQKLVIQDVVRYSARQFTAAKSVIQT